MKKALSVFLVSVLLVVSGMSIVSAQMDHHGTPDAHHGTPMAGHGEEMSMGAFYFTVTNNGDDADRLVEVKTDVAMHAEIHDVVMTDGVMQMQHQEDGVEIPAGESLTLEPGSWHIMLIGLNESLLDGEEFTATLVFENAGEVEITVPIHISEPDEFADPVKVGDDIEISNVWARQAPKLDGMATPMASPEGTPAAKN